MAEENFDRAFEYTVGNEGGFSNHKSDSGGPTKYGITIGTLARWRKSSAVTLLDVQNLTLSEAKEIYYTWYWQPLGCPQIENQLITIALFDAGVLFGVRTVSKLAQRVLQAAALHVKDDGLIGIRTIAALSKVSTTVFIVGLQLQLRERVYDLVRETPKNEVFKRGWENRIDRLSSLVALNRAV